MKQSLFISAILLILLLNIQTISSIQFCLQYKSTECIRCPVNTHVYQNLCYDNIIGCLQYVNGSICQQCNATISTLFNNTCALFNGITIASIQASNPGDGYGQLNFYPISLEASQKDNYFLICNNFMTTGQYSHFISKTAQPVISVSFYFANSTNNYKILYSGSGGGLLLCIIGISTFNNQINLRSLVNIGTTNVVDLCVQYSTAIQCLRCDDGYHLQNGVCYQNIGGCTSYLRNICLACHGFALLVQNRCITDCQFLSDTRSIRFYHNLISSASLNIIDRSFYIL